MKKFAILLALLLLQAPMTVSAANSNYKKQPAQKTQNVNAKQTPAKQQATPSKGDEYLLKYNINDLEAAPWLNGGKRKI